MIPDPKPYGVNQHGAIFKWTATDLDNIRRVVQVSQLTQSSHLALQPPYFFGGLGRPSNYVDYLYMGVSVRNPEKGSSMFWSGIIPNSQVVTIPYPPDEPTSYVLPTLMRCELTVISQLDCGALRQSRQLRGVDRHCCCRVASSGRSGYHHIAGAREAGR